MNCPMTSDIYDNVLTRGIILILIDLDWGRSASLIDSTAKLTY